MKNRIAKKIFRWLLKKYPEVIISETKELQNVNDRSSSQSFEDRKIKFLLKNEDV